MHGERGSEASEQRAWDWFSLDELHRIIYENVGSVPFHFFVLAVPAEDRILRTIGSPQEAEKSSPARSWSDDARAPGPGAICPPARSCSRSAAGLEARWELREAVPPWDHGKGRRSGPRESENRPVRWATRLGVHTPEAAKALVKRAPSRASRSMLGVTISSLP